MALNIDVLEFPKAEMSQSSRELKQKSPISPIESESSSGVSSLEETDEIKKQFSPSIFQADDDKKETEKIMTVFFADRDILDLHKNISSEVPLFRFAVLPENNVNCFFQNRAQYFRLSSAFPASVEQTDYHHENCPCCDFFYPSSTQGSNQGAPNKNNTLTDSLLTFLKETTQNNFAIKQFSSNNHYNPSQQFTHRNPSANGSALALYQMNALQSWTNSSYGSSRAQF